MWSVVVRIAAVASMWATQCSARALAPLQSNCLTLIFAYYGIMNSSQPMHIVLSPLFYSLVLRMLSLFPRIQVTLRKFVDIA